MATAMVTSASATSAFSQPLAKLQLPHPYLTRYVVDTAAGSNNTSQRLQIRLDSSAGSAGLKSTSLPEPLHHEDLYFTSLETPAESTLPPPSNNRAWARARRGPATALSWVGGAPPSFGQIWLAIYTIFTLRPELEFFRVTLDGVENEQLKQRLKTTGLAVDHPKEEDAPAFPDELLILRGAFWQGGGAPFGRGSVWIPSHPNDLASPPPMEWTMTTKFPDARVHQWHPQRPSKPTAGSVIYSRYIPSLDENFSMIALDYEDPAHLNMFHEWQNDPRVAAGWNETGTLEQHRTYLKNLHEDPHTLTILARFNDVCFAYFEVYWANEDHLGAYTQGFQPHDRGRHSLVGVPSYRGRHRVLAWWSALMHYMFLDDARTMNLVGEPKHSNHSVLMYDLMHGFCVEKWVDLPHKRSALVRCSREKFFQMCPIDWHVGRDVVLGLELRVALPSKL